MAPSIIAQHDPKADHIIYHTCTKSWLRTERSLDKKLNRESILILHQQEDINRYLFGQKLQGITQIQG
jgi:hypothetical protein